MGGPRTYVCALSVDPRGPDAGRLPNLVCPPANLRVPRGPSALRLRVEWIVARKDGRNVVLTDSAYLCPAHHRECTAYIEERQAAEKLAAKRLKQKVKDDEGELNRLQLRFGKVLDDLYRPGFDRNQPADRIAALHILGAAEAPLVADLEKVRADLRDAQRANADNEAKLKHARERLLRINAMHTISWARVFTMKSGEKKDEFCRTFFGFDWGTVWVRAVQLCVSCAHDA